jgi:predicted PolB exonuclease-like 3'-5' exonuclease
MRILIFDLQTVPDLDAVARVHRLDPADTEAMRAALGKSFTNPILHRIVALGALAAEQIAGVWRVRALGAGHAGERDEPALIGDFAAELERTRPRLITFSGAGFNLAVLRYRALSHGVAARGLNARPLFRRCGLDTLDLCDTLSGSDPRAKVGLDALCRALRIPSKPHGPDGFDGQGVAVPAQVGRYADIAAYSKSKIVATYGVFLAYERCLGAIDEDSYRASKAELARICA